MKVWNKLLSAVRGGLYEIGENAADSQALLILDQEIRDADEELKKTRESLAAMIARQKVSQESMKKLIEKIGEYEGYAMKALDKGDEVLSLEVAAKISDLEKSRRDEAAADDDVAANVAALRKSLTQAENNIRRLRQQIDTVRATESVQKAQMTVARRQGDGQAKLQTAMESLERIKRRQEQNAVEIEAYQAIDGLSKTDSLESRLKEAGIIEDDMSPESVLARLREKKAAQ
jgi:phage shock protein A